MTGRIVVRRPGGPEELVWEDVEVGAPGEGQVRVRHRAIGVNFIDVYHRTGLYPTVPPPFPLGSEAAGVVEAVGAGVTSVRVGDRVAYAYSSLPLGAYSEARIVPEDRLVVVPDGIDDVTAAAMMLKGMTAEYLLYRAATVKPRDAVLVHAAAGGVGLILCQWAKHLGAKVIGTVGTEAKAELAQANGCDHVILYKAENVSGRVRHFTSGAGVRIAYDAVGKDTFQASLDSLATRGHLVLYGQASGKVEAFDPSILARGSFTLTRPVLGHYTATREDLALSSSRLFEHVKSGAVKIKVAQTFPLREAARAHQELESRQTTGSTVLIP